MRASCPSWKNGWHIRMSVLACRLRRMSARALLELWVRKEALLKAAGIGLELEMDHFTAPEATPLPLPGPRFAGQRVELRRVHAGDAWVMAVASVPGAALLVEDRVAST